MVWTQLSSFPSSFLGDFLGIGHRRRIWWPLFASWLHEPKQRTTQDSVRADKKWLMMSQFAWKRLITKLVTSTWAAGFLPITWTSCSEQFCMFFFFFYQLRGNLSSLKILWGNHLYNEKRRVSLHVVRGFILLDFWGQRHPTPK